MKYSYTHVGIENILDVRVTSHILIAQSVYENKSFDPLKLIFRSFSLLNLLQYHLMHNHIY